MVGAGRRPRSAKLIAFKYRHAQRRYQRRRPSQATPHAPPGEHHGDRDNEDGRPARRGWVRRHWKATSIAVIALLIGAAIADGGGGDKASAPNPPTITKTVQQDASPSTGDTQPESTS